MFLYTPFVDKSSLPNECRIGLALLSHVGTCHPYIYVCALLQRPGTNATMHRDCRQTALYHPLQSTRRLRSLIPMQPHRWLATRLLSHGVRLSRVHCPPSHTLFRPSNHPGHHRLVARSVCWANSILDFCSTNAKFSLFPDTPRSKLKWRPPGSRAHSSLHCSRRVDAGQSLPIH